MAEPEVSDHEANQRYTETVSQAKRNRKTETTANLGECVERTPETETSESCPTCPT